MVDVLTCPRQRQTEASDAGRAAISSRLARSRAHPDRVRGWCVRDKVTALRRYGAITPQHCHAVALQNYDRFLHRNAIAGTPERQWQMPY